MEQALGWARGLLDGPPELLPFNVGRIRGRALMLGKDTELGAALWALLPPEYPRTRKSERRPKRLTKSNEKDRFRN